MVVFVSGIEHGYKSKFSSVISLGKFDVAYRNQNGGCH